jgi:Topoisomerase DNA binding C4 zinc finger
MRRLPFPKTCEELIELHKFGSDTEVDPGCRRPVQTDRKCEKCGSTMVLVRGPHVIFVGCMDYPKCQNRYSIRRGDCIGTNVVCSGKDALLAASRWWLRLVALVFIFDALTRHAKGSGTSRVRALKTFCPN